ncbi:MAG: hypothetical protein R2849_17970 [Thermomicrobiales bacterium]
MNHRVQKFDGTGAYIGQWGLVGNASADPGAFNVPAWVAIFDPVS